MGANYVAPYGLDQSTNHHSNTDVKDNDDSRSFETPRKIISVIPILEIQYPPQLNHYHPHCLHPENNIHFFILKGEVPMKHNV